jgi:hypothetical protein
MKSGTISYLAPIKRIEMEPIELSWRVSSIDKIEIKIEKEFLFITFFVNNVFCEEEALSLTRDAVELIASKISFEWDCQIGDIWCNGYSLPKKDENRHVSSSSLLLSWCIVGASTKPGIERIQKLKAYLEEPSKDSDRYLSLFRFSLNQTDSVTRFLFLYNLMLLRNGDKQEDVDAQIRSINNNTPVTQSPKGRGKMETIYTRLRNEVSHCRSNVDQTKTAKEIQQNVSVFQDIVRKSLSLR